MFRPTTQDSRPQVVLLMAGVAFLVVTLIALMSNVGSATEWAKAQGDKLSYYHSQDDELGLAACPPVERVDCPSTSALSCPPAPACTGRPVTKTKTVYAPAATVTVPAAAAPACDVDPAIVEKFGRHSVRLSQAHAGSGYRVQRVLERLNNGEKIKMALLGGSVSEGHGFLNKPNEYGAIPHDQIWHQHLLRDLQRRFGPDSVDFVFGAKAATDSSYFEWCYPAHIGTDADLILVELAVNDDFAEEHFAAAETLLRSLLNLPSRPAVVLVDSFAILNARGERMSLNGGDAHAHLALRYDVPNVSLRAAALTSMMADPRLVVPWFNGDQRHIAKPLHEMLGALVAAYFQDEGCKLERFGSYAAMKERWAVQGGRTGDWPGMEQLGEVPKNLIDEPWDATTPHFTAPPTCAIASPPEESAAAIRPVLPLPPDWTLFSWKYSKHYYQTTAAGSSPILFPVTVREGAKGEVAVGYLRAPTHKYDLGRARCEVVGTGQGAVLDGTWASNSSLTQVGVIARGLKAGEYQVSCATLPKSQQDKGKHVFRVASIMSV